MAPNAAATTVQARAEVSMRASMVAGNLAWITKPVARFVPLRDSRSTIVVRRIGRPAVPAYVSDTAITPT